MGVLSCSLITAHPFMKLASFLPSVEWTQSAVCSLAANPVNARFHSTLLKAAAHTCLCNSVCVCVSGIKRW